MPLTMDEKKQLFNVRKTVFEMLKDRGYSVDDSELEMKHEEFLKKFGGFRRELRITKAKLSNTTDRIFVFFPEEPNVNVDTLMDIVADMNSDNVHRAILVVQESLTPSAHTAMSGLPTELDLEIFQESELQVNISKHVLVPEHKVLTDEEKRIVLRGYDGKESQLPHLQVNDPQARYHGMKTGQVVRIVDQFKVGSEVCLDIRYRYVV